MFIDESLFKKNLIWISADPLKYRRVTGRKSIDRMEGTNRFGSVQAIECLALSGEGGSSLRNNGVINQVWVARAGGGGSVRDA